MALRFPRQFVGRETAAKSAEDRVGNVVERAMRNRGIQDGINTGPAFNAEELQEFMLSLDVELDMADVEDMIRRVDIDGDGRVSFEEFCLIAATSKVPPATQALALDAAICSAGSPSAATHHRWRQTQNR